MNEFFWIFGSTLAMSLIAWVGLFTFALKEHILKKITLPLVAFSAGALLGGAFLHLLPEAVGRLGSSLNLFLWLLVGFILFFILEQFLNWHHCHKIPSAHQDPVTFLILLADGLHNFIGGLAIAGSFLVDIRIGAITWLTAAAHEIPQEFGDFGILIHGGWKKYKALLYNYFSAFTVVLGGLVVFFASPTINVTFLLPFAAGNFIYIASSDLIPEIQHCEDIHESLGHFLAFMAGILLLLSIKLIVGI